MKKLLVPMFILCALFVGVRVVHAFTLDDAFKEIESLKAEVAQLKANLPGAAGSVLGTSTTGTTSTACTNGATNPPLCACANGSTTLPPCSITVGSCANGATNYPLCTTNTNGTCLNGATNPPVCACTNGADNPPTCSSVGTCLNGATNYPICTTNIATCANGATNPLMCTTGASITKDLTPRISYWSGKVNQHVNTISGYWETDVDGQSGASINQLTYCKKFYPNTTSVASYKNETISTWKDIGNTNKYTSTKMSYKCSAASGVCANGTSNYPLCNLFAGCATTSGYSATTGRSCSTGYFSGCTSFAGYSATTGVSCK